MASRKSDRVGEVLARLLILSTEDLRADWNRVYGSSAPPRFSRELLLRLQQIVGSIREGGEPATGATLRLKPGTRLLRDWHGRGHEVMVLDDGFSWEGRNYRSLSEIARAITGTRWSGPVFFGIKSRASAPRREAPHSKSL